jgi:hypothetical protein
MAKKKKPSDILNEQAFGSMSGQGAELFGDDSEKAKEFLTTPYEPAEKPEIKTEGEKRREAQELWEQAYGEKVEEPEAEIPEPAEGQRPLTQEQAIEAEEYEAPEVEEDFEQDPTVQQSTQAVEGLRSVDLGDMSQFEDMDDKIRQDYLDEIAEAKETYARTKDEVAQKKIWEALLNGFAALATAWYGNKTGLDLSGVRFSPSDWDSKLETAREDLAVAKSLAKDVRDVKLEGTDAKRTQVIREMQGNKAFNDSLMDKLRYDILTKQKSAKGAAELSNSALDQQKQLFDKVKDTRSFARYTDEKKKLEGVLEKYKQEPSEELLDEIRTHSNIMQSMSDQLSTDIGASFPNEYPPEVFKDTESAGLFGLWKNVDAPGYEDILKRRAASMETVMRPQDIDIYNTMITTPNTDPNKLRAAKYLQGLYPDLFGGGQ